MANLKNVRRLRSPVRISSSVDIRYRSSSRESSSALLCISRLILLNALEKSPMNDTD